MYQYFDPSNRIIACSPIVWQIRVQSHIYIYIYIYNQQH